MTPITYFYMPNCPYCRRADEAIEELIQENSAYEDVQIDMIDETDPPDDLDHFYEFYYVPTMYVGEEKIFEAHPGESYEEIKEYVDRAFREALEL